MRCEEATELVRIPREAFERIFEEDPYLGYRILKRVASVHIVQHYYGTWQKR